MNQFVQRLANYIANEVIIKGLANSRTFQKIAVRTDASLQQMSKSGTQKIEEIINKTTTASETTAAKGGATTSSSQSQSQRGPPIPPQRGFSGFINAFIKEVKSDFGSATTTTTTRSGGGATR
jgi:hypothetical protein